MGGFANPSFLTPKGATDCSLTAGGLFWWMQEQGLISNSRLVVVNSTKAMISLLFFVSAVSAFAPTGLLQVTTRSNADRYVRSLVV